jgi:hypothetical protein
VMAVALFAGVFNALTNLGGIADAAVVTPPAPVLKATAPAALCGFLTLSLLLSLRILVRLRLAFAQHSRALAELRDEQDPTSHRFRPQERTYLLYSIVLVLAAAAAALLARDLAGPRAAVAAAGAVLAAGAVWYPLVLRGARRREG